MPGAERGGDVTSGAEMLMAAQRGDQKEVKRFLDEHAVSVDLQNSSGKTALMLTKDVSLATMLLESWFAKVDIKDNKGKTAHALLKKGKAAQPSDKDMSALLLSNGATDTDTVLLAAQRGDLEAARRHLALEVPVDAQGWSEIQNLLGEEHMLALLLGRGYSEDIRVLKKERGDLAKDSLVLAVAAELDEEEFGNMVAGLVAAQLADAPHEAFNLMVHWMEQTDERTRKLRSPDPRSADQHADLFVRLQLAAAALLENVTGKASSMIQTKDTDEMVLKLLSHPDVEKPLDTALRVSAKELFAQPVMQRYVEHCWLGEDLQYELKRLSTSWTKAFTPGGLARRTRLVLLLLVNLLLLPVVALVPPLDKMLVEIDKKAAAEARQTAEKAKAIVRSKKELTAEARDKELTVLPPNSPLPSYSLFSHRRPCTPQPPCRCCCSGWPARSFGRQSRQRVTCANTLRTTLTGMTPPR